MVKGAGKICRRSKTVDAEIASAHGAPIMAPRGRISISLPCPTGWTAADNADYVNFRSSSPLRRRKVGPRFLGRKPASTPKVPKAAPGAVSAFAKVSRGPPPEFPMSKLRPNGGCTTTEEASYSLRATPVSKAPPHAPPIGEGPRSTSRAT